MHLCCSFSAHHDLNLFELLHTATRQNYHIFPSHSSREEKQGIVTPSIQEQISTSSPNWKKSQDRMSTRRIQSFCFAVTVAVAAAIPKSTPHGILDPLTTNPNLSFRDHDYSSPLLRRLQISDVCKDELDILWSEEDIDDPAEFLATKSALSKGCWGSSSLLNCDFEGLTKEHEQTCIDAGGLHHNIRIQGGCEMSEDVDGEFDLLNVPFCAGKSCDLDNLIEGLTGYADQCFLEFSSLDKSNRAAMYLIISALLGVLLTVVIMIVVRKIKARNAWYTDRLNEPRAGRGTRGSQAPTLVGNDDGFSDVDTFIDHARIDSRSMDHSRFGSHRLRYDPAIYRSESGLSESGRGSFVGDDISYSTEQEESGLVEVQVH